MVFKRCVTAGVNVVRFSDGSLGSAVVRVKLMLAVCFSFLLHLAATAQSESSFVHLQPDLSMMMEQMEAACLSGVCGRHSNTSSTVKNTTDCHARFLAYELALELLPLRSPCIEVFDALELQSCGVTRPTPTPLPIVPLNVSQEGTTVYIDPDKGSDGPGQSGGIESPFASLHHALIYLRNTKKPRTMILRGGVHFLNDTLYINHEDSGLTISAFPNGEEEVWISGGTLLEKLNWTRIENDTYNKNVYQTIIPSGVDVNFGLQTLDPHRRVTRARYPNGDPELCTSCWFDGQMKLWHKNLSCVGKAEVVYQNLVNCNHDMKLPDGSPCKNDSSMWDSYNTYTNGRGGCCSIWSGDQSPYGAMGSYFCGNSSAGGWVGYNDPRQGNTTQGLSPALPVGFDYDELKFPEINQWQNPTGAIIHVWRAQGWFVNMFEIASHDREAKSVDFAKTPGGWVKGGWQGGRGWQVNHDAINSTSENYLLAGKWAVENVREALDAPNEYFYNKTTQTLFYSPNTTGIPDPRLKLVAAKLQTLIFLNGTSQKPVKDVTIQGIKFRDAADTTMEPWGVPSGGDWGLYRGGALFLEGTEGVKVKHCSFLRLDNNAVFLSGYNRNAIISDNEFAWLGLSAAAAWGYSRENDGTDGEQPRFTTLERNYVREIGIIEKQSSMWFQAKSAQTRLASNVAFNHPRAAINFNDGFGGGNNATRNLLFNTCRETGDHGPINSWDRQPFYTSIATGEPSYTPAMSEVGSNMVVANYGASQGFDTDDGSSWYDIHDNFFYLSDGKKMDYGGHDCEFHHNIVYVEGKDGQNCVNDGAFLPGHGEKWFANKCILADSKNVGSTSGCQCPNRNVSETPLDAVSSLHGDSPALECGLTMYSNQYFARPDLPGNVTMSCDGPVVLYEWLTSGSDNGSNVYEMPSDELLFSWARSKLSLPPAPGPVPPMPKPLPPQPTPHYPDSCIGRCWAEGHCCANMVSGCQQPTCYQGCALAAVASDLQTCNAQCAAAGGKCSYVYKNVTLSMCNMCASVTPPQQCQHQGTCESVAACQDGCKNFFEH